MSITKEKTAELVAEFGANAKDTGNSRAQVAIITERVRNLTEHLKANPKDKHTQRGLTVLVGKRKALLDYIKVNDINEYRDLIQKLGLRK